MINQPFGPRLPEALSDLADFALDLRGSASQSLDRLWRRIDAEGWERTRNPWATLDNVDEDQLEALAADPAFIDQIHAWREVRRRYFEEETWFAEHQADAGLGTVAYFSMEFALSEALPIYSGGLGILAGDHLKSASDLGVPMVGVGLLYQQGYFRQVLDSEGAQCEAYPYNDPVSLPITPFEGRDGRWARVRVRLPDRILFLRLWSAQVGRVKLILLDSNDPMNGHWDRGITANLYAPGKEMRLLQEIVLGIGGWLALEQLGIDVRVCHLNEGHAAFAVLARAQSYAAQTGLSFEEALWVTRGGNVFTTHTPVEAAFDRYEPALMRLNLDPFAEAAGLDMERLLSLGRAPGADEEELFNMAFLAMRGCSKVNGVSRLHGEVSRRLFAPLFPRWPLAHVPVGHVTNGVHIPSWASAPASDFWRLTRDQPWTRALEELPEALARHSDAEIMTFRARARAELVDFVRRQRGRQLHRTGSTEAEVRRAAHVLDPNALTLGFARRFTEYKRPNLLLQDRNRFARILRNSEWPVQLLVAGKAHPNDMEGKRMVRELSRFIRDFELGDQVVFLEDYGMALAQHLVGGVDLWINTPRRPAEACGTSGMKVLVNGGLLLSTLDGWWAEAYDPAIGWQVGDGIEHDGSGDFREAERIYELLEKEIVPEFYARDADGVARTWVARIRESVGRLTALFGSDRMVREYVEQAYLPVAARYRKRAAKGGRLGRELQRWSALLDESWERLRISKVIVDERTNGWDFEIHVYLDELGPDLVRVELYADALHGLEPTVIQAAEVGIVSGTTSVYRYRVAIDTERPAAHFTPRLVPFHEAVLVPGERSLVTWRR